MSLFQFQREAYSCVALARAQGPVHLAAECAHQKTCFSLSAISEYAAVIDGTCCRADCVCVGGWISVGGECVCVYHTQFEMHQVNTTALFKMNPLSFLILAKLLRKRCNYDAFEKMNCA